MENVALSEKIEQTKASLIVHMLTYLLCVLGVLFVIAAFAFSSYSVMLSLDSELNHQLPYAVVADIPALESPKDETEEQATLVSEPFSIRIPTRIGFLSSRSTRARNAVRRERKV